MWTNSLKIILISGPSPDNQKGILGSESYWYSSLLIVIWREYMATEKPSSTSTWNLIIRTGQQLLFIVYSNEDQKQETETSLNCETYSCKITV
jgi:hypothetical protein